MADENDTTIYVVDCYSGGRFTFSNQEDAEHFFKEISNGKTLSAVTVREISREVILSKVGPFRDRTG